MTFSDFFTIVLVLLLAYAILVSVAPMLAILLCDLLWFATSVFLGYFLLLAGLNMVRAVVKVLGLIRYRSARA